MAFLSAGRKEAAICTTFIALLFVALDEAAALAKRQFAPLWTSTAARHVVRRVAVETYHCKRPMAIGLCQWPSPKNQFESANGAAKTVEPGSTL